MKNSLPVLFLASLGVALAGAILMMVRGLSANSIVLLAVGFGASVAFGLRVRERSSLEQREVSAAIRERAQKNWEMEMGKGKSPR